MKILTYNIHKGYTLFNRSYVLEELKAHLEKLNPDIVCLQEVLGFEPHFSTHDNQFEYLADELWPHFCYGRNAVYTGGDHGNAILSKWEIKSYENTDLTLHSWEMRGLLQARIDVEGTDVDVFTTHINLRESDRKKQLDIIAKTVEKSSHPVILAGDFNDWRKTAPNKIKLNEAFLILNGSYPKTFPSFIPALSLDRVFFKGLEVKSTQVIEENRHLSDHLGLMCEFELSR